MRNQKSKRETIIDSALNIFQRDGFHKARVEDIAKGANVGKGTIYEYFDSKRDLFYQMVKNIMDKYFEELEKAANEDMEPIKRLQNITKLQLEGMKKYENISHVVQVEAVKSGMGEDLKAVYIDFTIKQINLIEEIFQQGIDSKIFKEVNTYMATIFFIGGVNQLAFETCHMNKEKNEINIEEFLDIFLNGVMG